MNKPRTLEDIMADYGIALKLSKKSLDEVPAAARPGHAVAIRAAKERLPLIRQEYLTRVLKNSYAFYPEGEDQGKIEKFCKIAVENGAICVDGDAIFSELADRVQPTIGGRREFSINQVQHLEHALKTLVEDVGYEGTLMGVSIRELRVVPTKKDLTQYIRELVTKSNGVVPVQVRLQADIIEQAMKVGFTGKKLVVIVRNGPIPPAVAAATFTRYRKVDVDSVAEVDEKFAEATFREGLGLKKKDRSEDLSSVQNQEASQGVQQGSKEPSGT